MLMVSEYRHTNMKNYRQPWQSASNQNIWSTDFNQQQPVTSRNHCQSAWEYIFFSSNPCLYHVQYSGELLKCAQDIM